jgi:DNA polymerase III subunit alpha
VEATMEGDTLKLLGRVVQRIDAVVADAGSAGIRVHIGDAGAVTLVASLLERVAAEKADVRARGPVTLCIADAGTGREIDLALPRDYPVTPQIKGALKSLTGVVMVEEV